MAQLPNGSVTIVSNIVNRVISSCIMPVATQFIMSELKNLQLNHQYVVGGACGVCVCVECVCVRCGVG